MWSRSEQYIRKIGGLILVAAVVIWFLSYYPHESQVEVNGGAVAENYIENVESDAAVNTLARQSENSYLGKIGKFIEPVMAPLGLDWRASVAILSGASAKEIIVSTLGVLYSVDDAEDETASLSAHLAASGNYSKASALAMIIFILLYFPCIGTIAAIKQEAGGWKWALFSVVYNTALAWILAFVAYNIGMWLGL